MGCALSNVGIFKKIEYIMNLSKNWAKYKDIVAIVRSPYPFNAWCLLKGHTNMKAAGLLKYV